MHFLVEDPEGHPHHVLVVIVAHLTHVHATIGCLTNVGVILTKNECTVEYRACSEGGRSIKMFLN
jgi:hypothetical protein